MNPELKALLQVLFDMIAVIKDAMDKKDFVTSLLPKLYKVAADVPAVVSNWNDLMPEVQKLMGDSASDADLAAFIMSQIPNLSSDSHVKSVVSASLDLVLSVGSKSAALILAIKGE